MERSLFWHQGLFLQPQHFQLQDRYFQSLLTPVRSFLQPHFWGVCSLQLREAALGNLTVDLVRGEFLFPDGTFVSLPDNGLLEARSFSEDWVEGGKPLAVLIGLRKWNPGGENVTVLSSLENINDVATRFVTTTEPEDAPDMHQGGPPARVKRLHHVLKLFWASEEDQLGDYELIPLLHLERSGEEIIPAPRFFPPCVTVDGSDHLRQSIVEIRDLLASRAHQLEAYKRDRGIHAAEFGARDMVFLLALRSLNRYVPLLFHLTDARPVHPWTVYGLLRQIIGELSSFSETVNFMGEGEDGGSLLPPYNHRRLWNCFAAARSILVRLLDEITAGPDYMLQLLFDGTYFAAELPPAMFEGRNSFYLVVETAEDDPGLVDSFTGLAKLGSRETLPLLIARALPGIGLTHLEQPPQELPRRAGSLYFRIDHHNEQWQQVQRYHNLAVFWDAAPQDLKVELMVVGRS
ncbi:MAG TPA: type VI secretion system baseplate subunit TssK [Desulfobulbus sp.]|nr:type VI secretion system baseplate subunit TssK [Desulfobulbus sp.]